MRIRSAGRTGLLAAILAIAACAPVRPAVPGAGNSPAGSPAASPAASDPAARSSTSASSLALADEETAFMCPMHTDHAQEAPGKCPRCGMDLVLGTPFDMRDYGLEFQTEPAVVRPGETTRLIFRVRHPGTGATTRKFERVHDQLYHLFVISQDMEFFEHIHPTQREDGSWSIDVVLPKAGYFTVLSDFVPSGGTAQFVARPLVTTGYRGDLIADRARLVPDAASSKTIGALTATLTLDPVPLVPATHSHLTVHLTRGGTGEPVTELQTYLGAFGHMLIVSEDLVDYVHSHPLEAVPSYADPDTVRGGPDVIFEGLLPTPGRYRAWTQFRYQDTLHTFPFTFEVTNPDAR